MVITLTRYGRTVTIEEKASDQSGSEMAEIFCSLMRAHGFSDFTVLTGMAHCLEENGWPEDDDN